jgi:hypothetical protein
VLDKQTNEICDKIAGNHARNVVVDELHGTLCLREMAQPFCTT